LWKWFKALAAAPTPPVSRCGSLIGTTVVVVVVVVVPELLELEEDDDDEPELLLPEDVLPAAVPWNVGQTIEPPWAIVAEPHSKETTVAAADFFRLFIRLLPESWNT